MWPPQIQHNADSTGLVAYWLSRLWLRLLGWEVKGTIPPYAKFVLVGAHHTSNWDFFIALPVLYVYRIKVYWMGKDSLFKWPVGGIMRALGGIAIDRSSPQGMVAQMAQRFREAESLVVAIPAKGTRSKRKYWKSGFYHIAREAGVPVVCGTLDYSTKTAYLGYSFEPTGDIKADMDKVREFFAPVHGKYPELEDNIILKEESEEQ